MEIKLYGSSIKKFNTFSEKKVFLIFWETETPKKLLIFQEMELPYNSETSDISGSNVLSSKNDKRSGKNLQRLKNKKKLFFVC